MLASTIHISNNNPTPPTTHTPKGSTAWRCGRARNTPP